MSGESLHIRLKPGDKALVLFDLFREVFQQIVLQPELFALVVGFHQLQPGYIHFQIHTLFDAGITGTQRLNFCKGQCRFIHIVTGAHRAFAGHDL